MCAEHDLQLALRGAERVLDPLGTVGPSEEEAEVSVALRQGITCRPGPMVSSSPAIPGTARARSWPRTSSRIPA